MKKRVDLLLVERGLAPTREKAQAMILAGQVLVGEQRVDKAGRTFAETADIKVLGKDHPYVSRGGVKLAGALSAFGLAVEGFMAMDVGASTGGFTHCLLLSGAKHVYAVDVGYGQLAWELKQSTKVTSLERTNIRHLQKESIPLELDLIVVDASFISLKLIMGAFPQFLKPQGYVIALVKPQFEAGRKDVGKKGKVSATHVHERVLAEVIEDAKTHGFNFLNSMESTLPGKKSGNLEYFIFLQKIAD